MDASTVYVPGFIGVERVGADTLVAADGVRHVGVVGVHRDEVPGRPRHLDIGSDPEVEVGVVVLVVDRVAAGVGDLDLERRRQRGTFEVVDPVAVGDRAADDHHDPRGDADHGRATRRPRTTTPRRRDRAAACSPLATRAARPRGRSCRRAGRRRCGRGRRPPRRRTRPGATTAPPSAARRWASAQASPPGGRGPQVERAVGHAGTRPPTRPARRSSARAGAGSGRAGRRRGRRRRRRRRPPPAPGPGTMNPACLRTSDR